MKAYEYFGLLAKELAIEEYGCLRRELSDVEKKKLLEDICKKITSSEKFLHSLRRAAAQKDKNEIVKKRCQSIFEWTSTIATYCYKIRPGVIMKVNKDEHYYKDRTLCYFLFIYCDGDVEEYYAELPLYLIAAGKATCSQAKISKVRWKEDGLFGLAPIWSGWRLQGVRESIVFNSDGSIEYPRLSGVFLSFSKEIADKLLTSVVVELTSHWSLWLKFFTR